VRRYATQAPQEKKKGGMGLFHACVGLAALTGGYFYLRRQNPSQLNITPQKFDHGIGEHAFIGGDQGFISLVLDKSELVNHNTKRLTFKLPTPEMDSGLPVASAVIAKYKGPEMEKPVIRPYTPVSDVGELDRVLFKQKNEG
jgi:cytochrome-b5 reductase